jgi:putative zinc finger/helix-turn-helix YgiT family protein
MAEWPRPDGSECAVCGQRALIITDDPIADVVEGKTYYATGIRYNRCTACGEEFLRLGQGDEVSRQLFAQARVDLGRLSGDDIRSVRQSLGLTQAQLEKRLGVSTGLVGRWERSTVLQSAMADRYLRDLMAHPELVDSHGVILREGRGPYKKRAK